MSRLASPAMAFAFATAGRIVFGRGTIAQGPDLATGLGRRIFLVHGASGRHVAPVSDELRRSGVSVICHACPREPDLDMLLAALTAARSETCDCVVSIGGGAAIDLGKAVAGLLPAATEPLDHLEVVGAGRPLEAAPVPFMAVPTTAGTGAEVTRNAVIGVPGRKVSLRDARLLPRIALVDPGLTDGMPKDVTLATGLDAITQVIEPYLSARANPLTDALCLDAIPRGLGAIARLTQDDDADARDDMALVSLFGGLALANAGLGAVHGLAGVIGGVVPTAPHGAVCGALLPHVLRANAAACSAGSVTTERIDRVRSELWQALGVDGFAPLAEWTRANGLPTLSRMGIGSDMHAQIAAQAGRSSSMAANPVPLDQDTLETILKTAA